MQHVNTFNQVIKDFPEINDEDKAIIMLCSLPNSYEHLGTPPLHMGKTLSNWKTSCLQLCVNVKETIVQGKELEVKVCM
jgi:hypothetical protein